MKKILEGLGIVTVSVLGCAIYLVFWAISFVFMFWFAFAIINLIF